jgi:hypothetical protein
MGEKFGNAAVFGAGATFGGDCKFVFSFVSGYFADGHLRTWN